MDTASAKPPASRFSVLGDVQATAHLAPRGKISTWTWYALIILLFAGLFAILQIQTVPDYVHIAGVAVAALCLFPIALWYGRGRLGLPMFELICLAYGVQYCIPLYLQINEIILNSSPLRFTWDETFQSLMLVMLGLGAMIVAYYAARRVSLDARIRRVTVTMNSQLTARYAVVAIAVGLAIQWLQIGGLAPVGSSVVGEIVRVLSFQSLVAIALVGYHVYRQRDTDRRWSTLLYGTVASASILGLASGLLENAIVPLLLLIIVRWHAKRRFPFHWVVPGLLIFILLSSVKSEYRTSAWFGGNNPSVTDRLGLWSTLVGNRVNDLQSGDFMTKARTVLSPTSQRLDLLHEFVVIHKMTPNVVPYYQGRTYSYMLYGWIPRFLWPDKPAAGEANQILAQGYGLLSPAQSAGTTIGVGHLAEAYANFGIFGLLFIMALQGCFYALLKSILDVPGQDVPQAIYVAVMIFFLNGIGSATALLFSGAVENSLVSIVIVTLVAAHPRWGKAASSRMGSRVGAR